MKSLQQHIAMARQHLDELVEANSSFTDDVLADHLNNELDNNIAEAANRNQDYNVIEYVVPCVTDTYQYDLPINCLHVRRVELLKSGVTAIGNGLYSVSADAQTTELDRINLSEKEAVVYPTRLPTIVGYFEWDNQLWFGRSTEIATGYYFRIFYVRSAAPMHYGTVAAVASSTLNLSASPTVGTVTTELQAYKGWGIVIVSGTGAGQIRRISQHVYDGANNTITVNPAWTTQPTGAVYSIAHPLPSVFDDVVELGTAGRATARLEDQNAEVTQLYNTAFERAFRTIAKRNRQGPRRVKRT